MKKFDIEDHFKGKFSKEKECPVIQNAFDYIQIRGEYHPADEWDLEIPFSGGIKKEYTAQDLKEMQLEPVPLYTTIPDCEHDPVDVGFVTPKMVCKKCDVDLNQISKKECSHQNTVIWEPHLAGARKCTDCQMVYNPNCNPVWDLKNGR